MTSTKPKFKSKLKAFLAKFGVAAFVFYLVKGLIWLAVFAGAFKFIGN